MFVDLTVIKQTREDQSLFLNKFTSDVNYELFRELM